MRSIAAVVLIAALTTFTAGSTAFADVTVSISISGPIDELIPILEALRDMGITATPAVGESGQKIEMHSVTTREGEESTPPGPSELINPGTEPGRVRPGETALVSVEVVDPGHYVDTVAATLQGTEEFTFDLYDNGTHGDAVADDGVWTFALAVPPSAVTGSYTVVLKAFDRNGDPVMVQQTGSEPAPLMSELTLTVGQ